MTPIRSMLLAEKLAAVSNGEPESASFGKQLAQHPRLLEALWFLEWVFRQPGGGPRFVDRLVQAFPGRFQTAEMLQAGTPDKTGQWTLEQCLPVWLAENRNEARWDESELLWYELSEDDTSQLDLDSIGFDRWLSRFINRKVTPKDARGSDLLAKALQVGLSRFNRAFLMAECLDAATGGLPGLLVNWCEKKGLTCGGVWYCPELLQTLFDFMDLHAEQTARELAETEVTRIVFRELAFARSQNVPVPIVGDSRFGKTTAVSAWCRMHPGLARLVTVPESNRERDFFAAHADALGIGYHTKTTNHGLKRLVEFVHRHSGLFLVYDESHFLVPVNYHKATPPRRLNWVRCQVIDRDRGCAFFATPQSYRETLDAYVKKTGYCMEQWLGRLAPVVILPESLDSADVLAVARKHFPDVPEPYLKLISARAMQSEGYLKNMELCVKRALFIARERGHSKPDLADVREAIAWLTASPVVPEAPAAAPVRGKVRHASAPALQPIGRTVAVRLPARSETNFARRDSLVSAGELEPALAG